LQVPVFSRHCSVGLLHTLAVPAHVPLPLHLSESVHLLPSSQVAVAGLGGYSHAPDAGLQVPVFSRHWSVGPLHVFCVPAHVPCVLHLSLVVHAFPSSQLRVLSTL
jgi:hypothetical protein